MNDRYSSFFFFFSFEDWGVSFLYQKLAKRIEQKITEKWWLGRMSRSVSGPPQTFLLPPNGCSEDIFDFAQSSTKSPK